ncbi:SsgA family sporulation/cell division regulator [Streptomyces griseoincarnatus]
MNEREQQAAHGSGFPVWRPVLTTRVRRLFTASGATWHPCRFRYRVDEPLAVGVELTGVFPAPIVWQVSRDLLASATQKPMGMGGYRIWPSGRHREGPRCLYFSFEHPGGHVTFEADHTTVAHWLDGTWALVPPGEEQAELDWDSLELRLLRHGGGRAGRAAPRTRSAPHPGSAHPAPHPGVGHM